MAGLLTKTPTKGTVSNKSTVAGQMSGLMNKDNAYMRQARTSALQNMNNRGLSNTSIAVGAGEDAAIKSALPIAQQDAKTYGTMDLTNLNTENKFKENEQQYGFNKGINQQKQEYNVLNTKTKYTNDAGLLEKQAAHASRLANQKSASDIARDQEAARLDKIDSERKHKQALQSAYLKAVTETVQTASSDAASVGRTEGMSTAQQTAAMNKVYKQATLDVNYINKVFNKPQNFKW